MFLVSSPGSSILGPAQIATMTGGQVAGGMGGRQDGTLKRPGDGVDTHKRFICIDPDERQR
jgi:hypothetical protein